MWDYVEGRAKHGEGLLLFNFRYGAVEHAMRTIVERAGARIVLAPLRFPCRFDKYILRGRMGSGAYGVVYDAIHKGDEREIALKILDRRVNADREMLARILYDARDAQD